MSKSQVDTPLALRCAAEFTGTFLPFFSVGYILSVFASHRRIINRLLGLILVDGFPLVFPCLFWLCEVSMSFPGLQYLVDCP